MPSVERAVKIPLVAVILVLMVSTELHSEDRSSSSGFVASGAMISLLALLILNSLVPANKLLLPGACTTGEPAIVLFFMPRPTSKDFDSCNFGHFFAELIIGPIDRFL